MLPFLFALQARAISKSKHTSRKHARLKSRRLSDKISIPNSSDLIYIIMNEAYRNTMNVTKFS
jgi:hypothetical protein